MKELFPFFHPFALPPSLPSSFLSSSFLSYYIVPPSLPLFFNLCPSFLLHVIPPSLPPFLPSPSFPPLSLYPCFFFTPSSLYTFFLHLPPFPFTWHFEKGLHVPCTGHLFTWLLFATEHLPRVPTKLPRDSWHSRSCSSMTSPTGEPVASAVKALLGTAVEWLGQSRHLSQTTRLSPKDQNHNYQNE